ncbi:MAG: UDP-N-acetylmuramate dehydrogenase [Phycisphaerae bacterium]|nr:UDP-N-acetylmuramate dehydrogenase [Phycisphaerae bacterium]MDD5380587.1 UDP-N-acetylmuramate dehydrogenase [Phycisphaerae bacterium]
MNIFSGLEKIIETDYPLAKDTWYGLGGPADYLIRPETVEQLKTIAKRCNENDIPMYMLGFGSNLLIGDDGLRAAVIKLETEKFAQTQFNGEQIVAGAGAKLSELVLTCVKKGLSGLEALTGIPGSIGGAVKMNAGGNFGDIGAAIETVTLMDSQGDTFEKSKPELMFDYRSTNITAQFILNATLKLASADPEQIMRTVKEIWIYKKNSQPLNTRNCGCVFKNPRGVSAGALIDRSGLKGLRIGGAVVSEKHANFILAEDGCKSRDVVRLIDAIKERVNEQFGIELELEIEIWD